MLTVIRISWARIFPFAVKGSPLNQQGLDHYSDCEAFPPNRTSIEKFIFFAVIDYSNSLGVNPVVTLCALHVAALIKIRRDSHSPLSQFTGIIIF